MSVWRGSRLFGQPEARAHHNGISSDTSTGLLTRSQMGLRPTRPVLPAGSCLLRPESDLSRFWRSGVTQDTHEPLSRTGVKRKGPGTRILPAQIRRRSSKSPDAAQVPVWHTDSCMPRVPYAPGLILATPYACARHAAAMRVFCNANLAYRNWASAVRGTAVGSHEPRPRVAGWRTAVTY